MGGGWLMMFGTIKFSYDIIWLKIVQESIWSRLKLFDQISIFSENCAKTNEGSFTRNQFFIFILNLYYFRYSEAPITAGDLCKTDHTIHPPFFTLQPHDNLYFATRLLRFLRQLFFFNLLL